MTQSSDTTTQSVFYRTKVTNFIYSIYNYYSSVLTNLSPASAALAILQAACAVDVPCQSIIGRKLNEVHANAYKMKGTKVLTLGAGRDYTPCMQTLAIRARMRYICTHARYVSHARYCYWWAGPFYNSSSLTMYQLAESKSLACYTTR